MRRLLLSASALLLVACAKIAGLSTSTSGSGTGPTSQAGQLPPNEEGISAKLFNLDTATPTCGGPPTDVQYALLESTNAKDVPFALSLPEGSAFSLRLEGGEPGRVVEGNVPARGSVKIYIGAAAAMPGALSADVTVKTGASEEHLTASAQIGGGSLVVSPGTFDFGQVRQGSASEAQPIQLRNEGTSKVVIVGWTAEPAESSGQFAFSKDAVEISENPETITAALTGGPAGEKVTVRFTPQLAEGQRLCGDVPTLTLSGERVNQDIIAGPGDLPFGTVDCNSTPPPKAITITNFADEAAAFDVKLGPNTRFTVSELSGEVPAGNGTASKKNLDVRPVTAVLGNHTEIIRVDILSPEAKTINVVASMRVEGAILEVAPSTLSFNPSNRKRDFRVRNRGNIPIRLAFSSTNPVFNPSDTAFLYEDGAGFNLDEARIDVDYTGTAATTGTITMVNEPNFLGLGKAPICNTVPTVALQSSL